MKKLLSIILAAAISLSLVACSSNEETTSSEAVTEETSMNIISLAPATTEILTELGITDELVAVDLYVGAGYETLPAFDAFAPDIEAILALEPSVVFVSGMTDFSGKDLYTPLIDAGIEVVNIPTPATIDGIYTDIQTIADTVNKTSEGETLVNDTKAKISEISAIT